MKSGRAADLPAPGSPPSSRLRSGRPIADRVPVLVDAERERLPQRPAASAGPRSGGRRTGRRAR